MKKGGGRRYYRREDIALLSGIRKLLYDDGLSIKNVQAHLKTNGVSRVSAQGTIRPAAVVKTTQQNNARAARENGEDVPNVLNADGQGMDGANHADEIEDQQTETRERLNDALQRLLNAKERLNDTLE